MKSWVSGVYSIIIITSHRATWHIPFANQGQFRHVLAFNRKVSLSLCIYRVFLSISESGHQKTSLFLHTFPSLDRLRFSDWFLSEFKLAFKNGEFTICLTPSNAVAIKYILDLVEIFLDLLLAYRYSTSCIKFSKIVRNGVLFVFFPVKYTISP